VIQQSDFAVEPWCLRERSLNLNILAQSESVFALSNGHIGWRGNLDEGDPHGLSGSYLNGVHELRLLPYAEGAYGYPESDQVVVNVTNGKLIRLLVDDEPFDTRYGELTSHERLLDFRSGVLHREVQWISPSHRRVKVTSTRIVSLVQRSVAAVKYVVEAIDTPLRIVVQSELAANEALPELSEDPRAATLLSTPWQPLSNSSGDSRVELIHRTELSKLIVASAMDHVIDGPPTTTTVTESYPDLGRVTMTVNLEPGERLSFVKFVTYGWSAVRTQEALRDQVDAALSTAMVTGWDGLVKEQSSFLDDFWRRADVEVEGDDEIQQAVRFCLFHVVQASARAEERAIAAKGLTGNGYDGHNFWDTETFVLPVLTYTMPHAVCDALTWRHSTLPLALERALELGLKGAAFPWRTIAGSECSGYWPASTAAFHINADIADATIRYLHATNDEKFERDIAVHLLLHTARLWRSLGHFDRRGRFCIDGVTGPDEYSAIADNNIYTNLMAQRNLQNAAEVCERHRDLTDHHLLSDAEIADWRHAADAMSIPWDEELGVHPQSERFTEHQVWDFAATSIDHYPLLLHFPYFDLYRKQVVKQPDLVLAMYLRGDVFSNEQKAANFDYYERLTVRDSSLAASTQAVIAAEVGHLDLAYDYLGEAALVDLHDIEHNTRDGLHLASLAGTWTALVAGFVGMREHGQSLSFAPRLPKALTRIAVGLVIQGRHLHVETTSGVTRYWLTEGNPLELFHFGEPITVSQGDPIVCPTPVDALRPLLVDSPAQPIGREPIHRALENRGSSL
jgi:alpha,alpha-trehalose phosphorylase